MPSLLDHRRRFARRLCLCLREWAFALKNDDLGQDAVARFELVRPGLVHTTIADRESIAVDRVNAQQWRKLLLIGAREVDPIQPSRRGRGVELQLTVSSKRMPCGVLIVAVACWPLISRTTRTSRRAPARAVHRPCIRPRSLSLGDGFRTPTDTIEARSRPPAHAQKEDIRIHLSKTLEKQELLDRPATLTGDWTEVIGRSPGITGGPRF